MRSPKVQPEVILYDPELVATLPAELTVTSGLNAMAHAVEALYSRDANPLSDQVALGGIHAFVTGLPRVLTDPGDLGAHEETLFGSWLCGIVLAQVGMALHHKLCHTLGGSFDLPHAETHACFCRIPPPTMRKPLRRRWHLQPKSSAARSAAGSSISQRRWALRSRYANSGWRRLTSSARPT